LAAALSGENYHAILPVASPSGDDAAVVTTGRGGGSTDAAGVSRILAKGSWIVGYVTVHGALIGALWLSPF
jgi:hypothetical protein